jgi:hypothetical protein
MPSLPEAFFVLASARLGGRAPVAHRWSGPESDGKRVLEVPAAAESGFSVRVECETYGLYVYAEGWHGSPFECGPVTATPEETAENCLGFVRTLLCADSSLEVSYAGAKPYRWVLKYATDNGAEQEEMGLLVYNYFGSRSKRVLQNNHLPPRHAQRAA